MSEKHYPAPNPNKVNSNPAKLSGQLKRFNAILEYDETADSAYLYLPPFNHKTFPGVSFTQNVVAEGLDLNFDWYQGKIVGIEVLMASQVMDCRPIQPSNPPAPKQEEKKEVQPSESN